MKIVINEVQKFSKKDYWRFLKIRFKEDKTIILLYAAVGFYGFSLLFTILLGISPVFWIAPTIYILYCWEHCFSLRSLLYKREEEIKRRIAVGKQMVIIMGDKKIVASFQESDEKLVRRYKNLRVWELDGFYYVNLPVMLKKESTEAKEFLKVIEEKGIQIQK